MTFGNRDAYGIAFISWGLFLSHRFNYSPFFLMLVGTIYLVGGRRADHD